MKVLTGMYRFIKNLYKLNAKRLTLKASIQLRNGWYTNVK